METQYTKVHRSLWKAHPLEGGGGTLRLLDMYIYIVAPVKWYEHYGIPGAVAMASFAHPYVSD